VNTIIFGGSTVSEAVQLGVRKVFTRAFMNPVIGYGSTESGAVPVGFSGPEFVERPTSTGRVGLLHELQIRNERGEALGEGQQGYIWVRSAFIMLGYAGDPDVTAEVLDQELWLRTGDVGYMKDGFLYIDSRARDLILRSAENVSPTEVESRLDAHPAVRESAVFGVDDPVHLQAVKAVVVLHDHRSVSASELADWAAQALAKFKVPELWTLTNEPLPRNAAGKVMKDLLREKHPERTGP
jgi:acyl-CoA synthetase (AMP-forming)/AMP-acid ligase II